MGASCFAVMAGAGVMLRVIDRGLVEFDAIALDRVS